MALQREVSHPNPQTSGGGGGGAENAGAMSLHGVALTPLGRIEPVRRFQQIFHMLPSPKPPRPSLPPLTTTTTTTATV